jgi:shikimate kinase
MRIFLVGYMGSGKSTIGERLADTMDMKFVDLDAFITTRTKRTIQAIFDAEGEAGFRGIEKRCLHEVCEECPDVVVATGGGSPCYYDNMTFMKSQGLTIYLEMDVNSLTYRLENSDDGRPLIVGMDQSTLKHFVEQQLDQLIINALGFDQKKINKLAKTISSYSR